MSYVKVVVLRVVIFSVSVVFNQVNQKPVDLRVDPRSLFLRQPQCQVKTDKLEHFNYKNICICSKRKQNLCRCTIVTPLFAKTPYMAQRWQHRTGVSLRLST